VALVKWQNNSPTIKALKQITKITSQLIDVRTEKKSR
jgi:hypothetical protein